MFPCPEYIWISQQTSVTESTYDKTPLKIKSISFHDISLTLLAKYHMIFIINIQVGLGMIQTELLYKSHLFCGWYANPGNVFY